jgi:predicted nucleotidyltransferase component of viral defense system
MINEPTKSLYLSQDKCLRILKDFKPFGLDIILCGGTALARAYLQHRVSYDLDFFIDGTFDPERLAFELGKSGLLLEDTQTESRDRFVRQLIGYIQFKGIKLKVSFIEDSYAGMFPKGFIAIGGSGFTVESVEGLFHRKLRTVSGSGNRDQPIDGRQTARDLFDLFMLDCTIQEIPRFVKTINKQGANFPEKAFLAGLAAMPWIDMMDEFEQIDFDTSNATLKSIKPIDMMAAVRTRMQEIFKEMVNYG